MERQSHVTSARDENRLIDLILAGDRQRYAQLVDVHKNFVFTIAYKVVENREDAEEVAQDAFVKAYRSLNNFNRRARFSTWLYRIAFNTAISHKRKKRLKAEDIEKKERDIPHAEPPEAHLEHRDKQVYLSKAMEKLNDLDRYALQLFYLKELSLEEVAETMNQNLNTVKVRIHRARLRLAEELKRILPTEALTL